MPTPVFLSIALVGLTAAASAPELSRDPVAEYPTHSVDEKADAQLPSSARLEQLIREVYYAYESTVSRSGHDLRFRLSDFRTFQREDFDQVRWMELMTPPSGSRIAQWREYYDGPSVRVGEVVCYHLAWEPLSAAEAKATRQSLELLGETTVSRALALQRTIWRNELNPVAITSFAIDIDFAGRARRYRAAAFWHAEDDPAGFRMTLEDHVVPEVESAVDERAAPVAQREMKQLRRPFESAGDARFISGQSIAGSCKEESTERIHHTIDLPDSQGHKEGEHHSQFQLKATCHYGSDC